MNFALAVCIIVAAAMALRFLAIKLQARLLISETEQILNARSDR